MTPFNYEPLKTVVNGLMTRINSISLRKNWNENDPTKDSYIENRPFYSEFNIQKVLLYGNTGYEHTDFYTIASLIRNTSTYDINDQYPIEIFINNKKKYEFEATKYKELDGERFYGNFGLYALRHFEGENLSMQQAIDKFNQSHDTSFEITSEEYCLVLGYGHGSCILNRNQNDGETAIKVEIFQNQEFEKVHKIDPKYLPPSGVTSVNGETGDVQLNIPEDLVYRFFFNHGYELSEALEEGKLCYILYQNELYFTANYSWNESYFYSPSGKYISVINGQWTVHDSPYVKQEDFDSLNLITTADIDKICGAQIMSASEVSF